MGSGAFDNMGWIELIFVGVVALGFGFWQLWSVNREIAQDKKARDAEKTGAHDDRTEGQR